MSQSPPSKPRKSLIKIIAAGIGAVIVVCFGCFGFVMWYGSTPEYKAHATETAQAKSLAVPIAQPSATVEPAVVAATLTSIPVIPQPTRTQIATDTPIVQPTVTSTQPSKPTAVPTLAPTRTIAPTQALLPILTQVVLPTLVIVPTMTSTPIVVVAPTARVCCKVCTPGKSKACGDT